MKSNKSIAYQDSYYKEENEINHEIIDNFPRAKDFFEFLEKKKMKKDGSIFFSFFLFPRSPFMSNNCFYIIFFPYFFYKLFASMFVY